MSEKLFYLAPVEWHRPYLLKGSEAHHALKVLRLRLNDQISLFDGLGRQGIFKIINLNKDSLELELLSEKQFEVPKSRAILALAWTKAIRRSFIFEKAVELSVSEIWLWQAERSQFALPSDLKSTWQNQLIAGAKQCHNVFLPKLRIFSGLGDLIATSNAPSAQNSSGGVNYKYVLLEADYQTQALTQALETKHLGLTGTTIYTIGPEGGFSQAEVDLLLKSGFTGLSMGTQILRYETAAMLALGLHWWRAGLDS